MTQPLCFDAPEIGLARINLTDFVQDLAAETATEFGFGWRASTCSPDTLDEVTAEFRSSQITGLPVRVSSLYCDRTIYVAPADNIAYRFVHDSRHVFLQAGFDKESELLVASCHLARLRRAGFGPDSIEHRLMYADTVGQVLYLDETGEYVINQLRFALRCLDRPLQLAIEEEAREQVREAS